MEISPAKRVGRILELLRNDAGKTQAEVAKEVHCDHTYISHIEKGNKRAHIETVRAIGKALGHQKAIEEIWGFAGVAGTSATAELLAGYEAEAVRISTWTTTVFHALLQTEPYARAVIRTALPFESDAVVDELVAKRMERQGVFTRRQPPLLWSVVDESVFYRTHGADNKVMHDQLAHLEEQSERPGVFVQVVPFGAAGNPGGVEGMLGIVDFRDKTPVWYSDAWSAGKLSDDQDEVPKYARYFDFIRAAALSLAESFEFIARVRRERYGR
jgi:DNA-binding XRE family transcriptional regulator